MKGFGRSAGAEKEQSLLVLLINWFGSRGHDKQRTISKIIGCKKYSVTSASLGANSVVVVVTYTNVVLGNWKFFIIEHLIHLPK